MSKRGHMLDHVLGRRMASTLPIKPRRKSEAELRQMEIEDRLIYERDHPLSDAEKYEALEREIQDDHYDLTGEVDHQDLLDNHPPADWGT